MTKNFLKTLFVCLFALSVTASCSRICHCSSATKEAAKCDKMKGGKKKANKKSKQTETTTTQEIEK